MTTDGPPAGAGEVDPVAVLQTTVEVQQVGLNRLADQVRHLTTLVDQQASHPGAAGPEGAVESADESRPAPWCWRGMPPRQAAALWRELAGWVEWLHQRYPLAEVVLPCWWRHPEVVEELTAVHAAWKFANTSPGANPYGPAEWHDHWLPGLEQRLTGRWRTRRCTDGHQPTLPSSYGTAIDDPDTFRHHTQNPDHHDTGRHDAAGLDEVSVALDTGAAELIGHTFGDPIYWHGRYWQITGDADGYREVTDPDQNRALNDARRRQRLTRDNDAGSAR